MDFSTIFRHLQEHDMEEECENIKAAGIYNLPGIYLSIYM